jgi:predicted O-methyltransferase YrrM
MADTTLNIDDRLHKYLVDHSVRDSNLLQDLRKTTHQLSESRMQISPEQGQFMGLLVKLIGAKKTLDIGTFTGYSSLIVALSLPADGTVYALDVSDEWTNTAKKFWQAAGVANKVKLLLGPAEDSLKSLLAEHQNTFDFAFIDADKANYDSYYELSLKLLRRGGVIAVDNVLWDGAVADPEIKDVSTEAIRALNRKIHADSRVDICMLPIGDGVTLAMKK